MGHNEHATTLIMFIGREGMDERIFYYYIIILPSRFNNNFLHDHSDLCFFCVSTNVY